MTPKPPLSGIPQEELAALLAPLPAFRSRQIAEWLRSGTASFDEMTNLPAKLRAELAETWSARTTTVRERLCGAGGTVKLQIGLEDGAAVEAVLLVDGAGRKTACLSVQVGCPMGCVFCKTGTLGLARNLNSAEIVEQFYHLGADIANIVFMGMGEPLLNLSELRRAIALLTQDFSKRRITVSTCGITEGILELERNGPDVRLAVSVPSARQNLRDALMPGCAGQPLAALKKALLPYQARYGKRITLETVLLGGINTKTCDADALADFACGLAVMVNLIPWNSTCGLLFEGKAINSPTGAETSRFAAMLEERGLTVAVRRKKGDRIFGACGQLGAR